MRIRVGLALVFAAATPALACVWTTDTIKDEIQIERNARTFDLITGQFPHHGAGYWRAIKRRSLAALQADPSSIRDRNDLGVALLKLKEFSESEKVLKALEADAPERYETLSNLGVLFKKMGRFEEAAAYTARALKIKPSGHLGLGDIYLHMLRYRAGLETGEGGVRKPNYDFLGGALTEEALVDRPLLTGEVEDQHARLRAMIRSDRRFADGLLVFGDLVLAGRQRNLRLWAYVRALQLGHPRPDILRGRIQRILDYWKRSAGQSSGPFGAATVQGIDETIAGITAQLENAELWLEQFEAVEGAMVAEAEAAGEPLPDFEAVLSRLEQLGNHKMAPAEHGLLSPTLGSITGEGRLDWLLVIGVALVLLLVLRRFLYARARERRALAEASRPRRKPLKA